jgi:hypothetical protein
MPQIVLMMGKYKRFGIACGLDKLGRGMKRIESREKGRQNCENSNRSSRRNVIMKWRRRCERDKRKSGNVNRIKQESGRRLVIVRSRHGRANMLDLTDHVEMLAETVQPRPANMMAGGRKFKDA